MFGSKVRVFGIGANGQEYVFVCDPNQWPAADSVFARLCRDVENWTLVRFQVEMQPLSGTETFWYTLMDRYGFLEVTEERRQDHLARQFGGPVGFKI